MTHGVPEWLRRLSIRLLVCAQVRISGSLDWNPHPFLGPVLSGDSAGDSLSLYPSPHSCSLSQIHKYIFKKKGLQTSQEPQRPESSVLACHGDLICCHSPSSGPTHSLPGGLWSQAVSCSLLAQFRLVYPVASYCSVDGFPSCLLLVLALQLLAQRLPVGLAPTLQVSPESSIIIL